MEHDWYYRIEVEAGVYTSGRPIGTLGVIKEIFDCIDFKGVRALDIGTQEFVAPILLQHQGAADIVAYDRLSLVEPYELLEKSYDLGKTRYVHGMSVYALKKHLEENDISPYFDFVNFTGVLYHMPDPLVGLAVARSFLSTGGLMLLETSVTTSDKFEVSCNKNAELYPYNNYFQLSPAVLDYWCRALRLEVVDAFWRGGNAIKRLFFVLRGIDTTLGDDSDTWIRDWFWEDDFTCFGLDFPAIPTSSIPPVYRPLGNGNRSLSYVDGPTRYLDVPRTLAENPDLDEERRAFRRQALAELRRNADDRANDDLHKDEATRLTEAKFSMTSKNSLSLADVGL